MRDVFKNRRHTEKGESVVSKETIPDWIQIYWTENPTHYTSNDIYHLEPGGLSAVFAKMLALKSGHTPITEGFLKTNTGGYFMTNTGGRFRVN